MWSSKGRSGYGDSTIGGDYDSWDGLSMNGKQYRNEATMETRDLSGADYWHLRKQNRPTETIPENLHMLSKGRANIEAYAQLDEPVNKRSKISIEDKILPQAKRVRTLTQQIIELEQAKKAGMDIDKYSKLRDILICKRQRSEVLLQKALSVKPETNPEDTQEFSTESYETSVENGSRSDDSCEDIPQWLLNVKDSNSLKKPLIKACKAGKTLVRWHQKARNYINELKAL